MRIDEKPTHCLNKDIERLVESVYKSKYNIFESNKIYGEMASELFFCDDDNAKLKVALKYLK